MSKILFIASVYYGHLSPARPLINSLEARGNIVESYIPEQFMEKVQDWGIKAQAYPKFDELDRLFNDHLITGDLHERLYQLVHNTVQATFKLAPWLIEKLEHNQYDLIIYDNMALWGHVAANIADIPSICSTGVMPINHKTIEETGEGSVYVSDLPAHISEPLHDLQNKYPSNVASLLDLISG
jgi:UDP:flavonoid glycosyltransferase YjiC (YdhE family)